MSTEGGVRTSGLWIDLPLHCEVGVNAVNSEQRAGGRYAQMAEEGAGRHPCLGIRPTSIGA